MRQGDFVVRKSYGGDVIFKIQEFSYQTALLRGVDVRLLADAAIHDLMPAPESRLAEHEQDMQRRSEEVRSGIVQGAPMVFGAHSAGAAAPQQAPAHAKDRPPRQTPAKPAPTGATAYFEVPGKVLHLDGDPNYLRKSMALYGDLRVPAEGLYVPEASMSEALLRLLPQVRPDIVVITGHDGILKDRKERSLHSLTSYKNSQNFVNAVKVARQYERNRDALVVIAGACQSHFEALLQAGANYASSPGRVLIHALDPLYIAAKVSFTSIRDTVPILDVLQNTLSGLEGLGGVETRGSYRMGLPRPKPMQG